MFDSTSPAIISGRSDANRRNAIQLFRHVWKLRIGWIFAVLSCVSPSATSLWLTSAFGQASDGKSLLPAPASQNPGKRFNPRDTNAGIDSPPTRTPVESQSIESLPTPIGADELRLGVLLRAARNAVGLHDVPLAIQRFEKLFREFPDYSEAKIEYIGLLIQNGQLPVAEQLLARMVQQQPDSSEALELYANILVQQSKHAIAESTLRRMVESGQTKIETVVTFARVLAWQGKLGEASLVFQQRLRDIGPLSNQVENDIANLLIEIKRPADAMRLLSHLYQDNPNDPAILVNIVLANARLGQDSAVYESIALLNQNQFAVPNQRLTLGDILYREGYFRYALQVYHSIQQFDPSNVEATAKIARTHVRLLDFPAAKATLDSITASNAERVMRLEMANYKTAVGEHADAYAIYQTIRNETPQDAVVLKGLGSLYLAIGDYRTAESVFRQAAIQSPRDTELQQLLADALLEQLRIDEAAAILSSPSSASNANGARDSVGTDKSSAASAVADILLRGRRFAEAETTCNSVIPSCTDPQTIMTLRTTLGFALLKQGRNAEAMDALSLARPMPGGNSAKLRYGLYRCLSNLDRTSEGEAVLAEELRMFGPNTFDRVTVAQLAMEDCNCLLADRVLQQALAFDPKNVYVMILLAEARGMCNRCNGDCDDRSQFQSALSISPSNTRAQLGLARSYSRTNAFSASHENYQRILNAFPQHDVANLEAARVSYAWKGADSGNHYYAVALNRNRPQDVLPHNSFQDVDLASLEIEYQQAGNRVQSITLEKNAKYFKDWKPLLSLNHYGSLTGIDPRNQEAQFDRAQVLSSLNQTSAAIEQYNRLLDLDPCHTEARIAKRRMQLEQRPQLRETVDFEYRAGRQGLTDISLMRLQSVVIKPIGDQDEFLIAGYAHQFLWPVRGNSVDGNIGILGFQSKPFDFVNVFATAEIQQYSSGFNTRVPFRAGTYWHTPSDVKLGFAGFLENLPANGEAIRQDTYRGGLEVTAAKYLTWRCEVDSMYRFAGYSDSNTMHEATIKSNYLIIPGRNQLRAKVDGTFLSFAKQTVFAPTPGDLTGTIHPYFSPGTFTYVSGGLEYRTWLSPHNFRGSDEHWYSAFGGARVDSDGVGYGLMQFAGHRDYNGWISSHLNMSGIFSSVYQSVGVGAFLTIRFP